jgi:hypothetical protein
MSALTDTVATLLQDDIPEEYICPITQDFMRDPVIAEDGHTYEREAITAWLTKHSTSPITREYISHERLLSDPTLKKMIEDFVKERQQQMMEKQLKLKERVLHSSSEDEIEEIRVSKQSKLKTKDFEERVPLMTDDADVQTKPLDNKEENLKTWEARRKKQALIQQRLGHVEVQVYQHNKVSRPQQSGYCWSCTLF